jgi:homoserine kinase
MASRLAFRAAPVHVRVPATSANLGPGFDALGLALDLYDDVIVRVAEDGLAVDVAGEGADDVPRDRRNLVVRSLRATFDKVGGHPRGLEVVCANRIPHGRGLGSSAAAIVAGVLAARELAVAPFTDADVLALCAELEGHPDNVAACLLGGLTIAWNSAGTVAAQRLEPHADLAPVVFVPGVRSSTAKARKLLPDSVPHDEAARNAGRAALLVASLTSTPQHLLAATEDWLHQPYRAEAMPRTAALLQKLRDSGVAAAVSGAGPSVIALTTKDQREAILGAAGRGWTALAVDPDRTGAHVVET